MQRAWISASTGFGGATPLVAQPQRAFRPLAATSRRCSIVLCASRRPQASKAVSAGDDGAGGAGQRQQRPAAQRPAAQQQPAVAVGAAAYSEALLQREYELWQRQSEMYERLQDAHDQDLERFAAERAAWQQQEAAMRQEAAELRAQLLYVLAQLNALQAQQGGGGGAAMPQAGAASSYASAASPQAAFATREPAASLPFASSSSSRGLSPAEQVKAVVDAMKPSGGSQPGTPATPNYASSSSFGSPVNASAAWPPGAESAAPPAYAADLAAAVAAVDNSDVLTGVSMFELQERRAAVRDGARTAPAGEPASAPAAAAVAAAPEPAQQEAAPAAAEEAGGAAAGADPRGPPPMLNLGADDIFWVNQLHTGLVDLGYFPGDADIDEFFFGEGTQSALLTMQCCEGLEETGVADEATWARLLGPAMAPKESRDLTADMMLNVPGLSSLGGSKAQPASSGSSAGSNGGEQAAAKPYSELFTAAFTETVGPAADGGVRDVQELTVTDTVSAGGKVVSDSLAVSQEVQLSGGGDAKLSGSVQASHTETYTEWPVLHEGDGGRAVHAMHVALQRAGFYPSEDDMRWWTFGDGTLAALKTFQACSGYPESGVCDAATWRFLMGQDADPSEISQLRTGDSADEDLADQAGNRVWLIGEQRWEDRSRMKRG